MCLNKKEATVSRGTTSNLLNSQDHGTIVPNPYRVEVGIRFRHSDASVLRRHRMTASSAEGQASWKTAKAVHAAADKPTTSGSWTKSLSPASTTTNLLGPPPRSGIFQCRPKDTAFPFSVRSYRTPDDCLPLLQPKRKTAQTKTKPTGMTIYTFQEVPDSDLLGAKPKKPPRMTATVKPERSASSTYSNASSSNKTSTRAPPFRNDPRVYSSTALKNFNVAGKQGLADNKSGERPAVHGDT
ncbi:hypothetical protein ISCGN_023227 [Ixodes scapularis]